MLSPLGSCPVDFAYSVHTAIGNACIGARVNGRLVPLTHQLKSGDTCEIFTSKVESASPSREWLEFVASPKARHKVKQWFSREKREDLIEAGREDLSKELRRVRLPVNRVMESSHLTAEMESLNYLDLDTLLAAIGEGHVEATQFAQRIAARFEDSNSEERLPASVLRPDDFRRRGNNVGIHVEGFDDVLVRLSKCCTPFPVTKSWDSSRAVVESVSIGPTVPTQEPSPMINHRASWTSNGMVHPPELSSEQASKSSHLTDRASCVMWPMNCPNNTSISWPAVPILGDRVARMRFEFELADPGHLEAVLRTIKKIDGVYDAYRSGTGRPLDEDDE